PGHRDQRRRSVRRHRRGDPAPAARPGSDAEDAVGPPVRGTDRRPRYVRRRGLRDGDAAIDRGDRARGAARRHVPRSHLHRQGDGRVDRKGARRRVRRPHRALLAYGGTSGTVRMIRLTFFGAARTVTGSKYLVESNGTRIMVDAGLFQGLKELRLRNWQDLPVPASSIEAIVLTHAHLDHCGYLPRLVAQGFRGRVFCTQGTQDLCKIVLPDAGRLQAEDAEQAHRHNYTKHAPALPLYREVDAFRAVSQLQPIGYDRPMPVAGGIEITFINAGHLLGSSYSRMQIDGRTILFGGDLGRFGRPVLPDPTPVDGADYLLVESTYGDRLHERDDDGARLAEIVTATAERGGKLIVPAFAIGRVEELIYWL